MRAIIYNYAISATPPPKSAREPISNMKLLCLSIVAIFLVSSLEASPGEFFKSKPVIKYAFQSLNKFFSLFTEKENFASTQHRQRYSIYSLFLYTHAALHTNFCIINFPVICYIIIIDCVSQSCLHRWSIVRVAL